MDPEVKEFIKAQNKINAQQQKNNMQVVELVESLFQAVGEIGMEVFPDYAERIKKKVKEAVDGAK